LFRFLYTCSLLQGGYQCHMCPINGTYNVGDMSQDIEVTFHCRQILHLRENDVAA
ncbi:hypothetical protein NDU88_004775, partial [Pleurodeles waltl]